MNNKTEEPIYYYDEDNDFYRDIDGEKVTFDSIEQYNRERTNNPEYFDDIVEDE